MKNERGKGCCLGMAIGCLGMAVILTAIGFGLYFWLNPQKRGQGIEKVEVVWGNVKNKVDAGLEKAKPAGEPQ